MKINKLSFETVLRYTNLIIFSVLLIFSANVSAKIKLARIFTDNAVLQREKPIPVWGRAETFERVEVSLADQKISVNADQDGSWRVEFAPMQAGGPFVLSVRAGTARVSVQNILIGEVWLCSGQSNMEWPVSRAKNFEQEKKNSDFPQIRHFYIPHDVALEPKEDLKTGEWKKSSAETVGDFTAVGFFFARKIHRELSVPVGLIHSSWGGSQIESWISLAGMLSSEEFGAYARDFPKNWAEADARLLKKIKKKTLGDENATPTRADERRYTGADFDFSDWHRAAGMGQWDWQGIWAWRGSGFMAKRVEIPAEFTAGHTVLGLAEGYQYLEVYINGTQIFTGILKGKREIVVPPNVWKTGENNLVLTMNPMIEPEWFGLGFMGSADGLFVASKDEKIYLGGNDWHLMPAFAEEHSFARLSNNIGTAVYNAMIAPLVPYAIRGVLWYQGESNAGRSFQYRRAFPLLINDWRAKWNEEFPFYFVQLSSFGANQSSNIGSGWAELREAQTQALSLPKTGMAVTIDIGNPTDVHPINKQDVAWRLAANALKLTYGKDIPHSSPLFESVEFESGRAIVSFKYTYDGLSADDKYGYVRGFEIAGEDGVFYYAKAEIDGDKVIVHHPKVPEPSAVRYAWSDAPVDANLYNSAGFPASPFRTDNWKSITENIRFH